MKIRNVLFALALVAIPAAAEAQVCANNPCEMLATGKVQSSVTVTLNQGLGFDAISAGADKIVALTDAAAGYFTVVGNAAVTATFAFPSELVHTSNASQKIAFAGTCGAGTTQAIAAANPFTSCTNANPVLTGPGTALVYVGGTASGVTTSHLAGNYEGTIRMTTSYPSY